MRSLEDVAEKMQAFCDRWWTGVESRIHDLSPINGDALTIGSDPAPGEPVVTPESVTFTIELPVGRRQIQGWLTDADGNPVCGAYYGYTSLAEGWPDSHIPLPRHRLGLKLTPLTPVPAPTAVASVRGATERQTRFPHPIAGDASGASRHGGPCG